MSDIPKLHILKLANSSPTSREHCDKSLPSAYSSITETLNMSGLLGKKFPAPVAKPMWPFYAGGLVIFYGVSSLATFLSNTEEHRNDPRNPNAAKNAANKH